jgi:hypothetical protein
VVGLVVMVGGGAAVAEGGWGIGLGDFEVRGIEYGSVGVYV